MGKTLATVEQLQTRMGVVFDEIQTAQAQAALDDASSLVRLYGKPKWGIDPKLSVPDLIVSVVLSAAERRMRNPEGYVSETAGEYSYRRPSKEASSTGLTDAEIDLIERLLGRSELSATPTKRLVRVGWSKYYPYPNNADDPWDNGWGAGP